MNEETLSRFRTIKDRFFWRTDVPLPDCWLSMDDEQLWMNMVVQVMVVGGSGSVDNRFLNRVDLRQRIAYSTLVEIASEDERKRAINSALRDAKIRYASSDLAKCHKTKAIAENFHVIRSAGGPEAFVQEAARLPTEYDQIEYVMEHLAYFKSKGARDFLMSHGLVRQALAFDTRVLKVLRELGVNLDGRVRTHEVVYRSEEARVLRDICSPLGLSGVEFDRMIYQNQKAISHWVAAQKRNLKTG